MERVRRTRSESWIPFDAGSQARSYVQPTFYHRVRLEAGASSAIVNPSPIPPVPASSHQPGNSVFLSHNFSSSLQLQSPAPVCRTQWLATRMCGGCVELSRRQMVAPAIVRLHGAGRTGGVPRWCGRLSRCGMVREAVLRTSTADWLFLFPMSKTCPFSNETFSSRLLILSSILNYFR